MSASAVPAYVINLDRSPDRLAAFQASAVEVGLSVIRVPAVDGRAVDVDRHRNIDRARFRRINGREMVPGELGCYLSHVRALEELLASPHEMALICEDDILFTVDTVPVLDLLAARDDWEVVKLYSSRYRGFQVHHRLSDQWTIGRCLHGPSGCSAAYAVTKEGARRLLASLDPMCLPYDVALERGWSGDIEFYMTDRRAVAMAGDQPSTIVAPGGRLEKYPFYRRGGTLAFRATEYIRRMAFAMSRSRRVR
jgi:glycosyl transferase, family 25